MFNHFLARTAATLQVLGATTAARAGARTRAPRGVTFIEYALMAVVAVVIGWLMKDQLGTAFTSILNTIKKALNTKPAGF